MAIRRAFTDNMSYAAGQYVGDRGDLFYDTVNLNLRLSDGVTPGGVSVCIAETTQTISSLADLPAAVGGVITLVADHAYHITGHIDLLGARIEAAGITAITGTSSETASFTSTGLANSIPLLTSRYTMPIRDITFKDVHTGIYFDDNGGANAPLALDWRGVNFDNVPNIGTIGTVDNFIFETGSFLDSQNLIFSGTAGTIGVVNSLLRGNGTAGDIIKIAATAVVTRRFRMIYSSVIATGSTQGINVVTGSTIPSEGFILDTVNFAGGGTYLAGITTKDERALFTNLVGVLNTTALGQLYMKNNATATDVIVANTLYRVAGTTETATSVNQKFSHIVANNALRYTGAITRTFHAVATFAISGPTNNVIGVALAKKPAADAHNATTQIILESEVMLTAEGTRPDAGTVQAILEMATSDELYLVAQNTSGNGDITVKFMNMVVQKTQ
jgi:hypothetical protein